jgi:hypothetical protein
MEWGPDQTFGVAAKEETAIRTSGLLFSAPCRR